LEHGVKIFLKWFSLLICFGTASLNAQILRDTSSLILIRKGVDYIYNMQFSEAGEIYQKISSKYPGNPVVILYSGIMTYWENYPLLPSSAFRPLFEDNMRKCIGLCDKNSKNTNDTECLLANLCARGMLLTYYSNNDMSSEVFPLATSTYKYINRSFEYTGVYSDFYLFTGLYNYYREVYPKVHPIYKPLVVLFRKGNREAGLEDLQKSARNSIFLKAESVSDISYIYLTYENDYQQAMDYSRKLHELYPSNPEFMTEYIKNLLLVRNYEEAERLIMSTGPNDNNGYYQAQILIFKGLIQEKMYHNNTLAEQYYNKGIHQISKYGPYGNEFSSYAYFGLSRISGVDRDKESRKNYRKQAIKLADSKKIDFD
jgi:tetratricopeptide (TPR) repeat protein